tara:strand:- start:619 stop:1023 length:405 start_codon:yes stop_codon:yes gene_type:complete
MKVNNYSAKEQPIVDDIASALKKQLPEVVSSILSPKWIMVTIDEVTVNDENYIDSEVKASLHHYAVGVVGKVEFAFSADDLIGEHGDGVRTPLSLLEVIEPTQFKLSLDSVDPLLYAEEIDGMKLMGLVSQKTK